MDNLLKTFELLCSVLIASKNVNGTVTACQGHPPGTMKIVSPCNGIIYQPVCLLCNTSRSSKDVSWFVGNKTLADKGYNFDATHGGGLAVNGCPEYEDYSLKLERPSKLNHNALYYCQHKNTNVSKFLLSLHADALLRINTSKESNGKLILDFEESTDTLQCVITAAIPPMKLIWWRNNMKVGEKECNCSWKNITEFYSTMTFKNLKSDDILTCSSKGMYIHSENASLKVSFLHNKEETSSSSGDSRNSESTDDEHQENAWHRVWIPSGLFVFLLLISLVPILFKRYSKKSSFDMDNIPRGDFSASDAEFRGSTNDPYSQITDFLEGKGNGGNCIEEETVSTVSKVKNDGVYEYWTGTYSKGGTEEKCFAKSLSSQATLQEASDFQALAKRMKGLKESTNIVRLLCINIREKCNPFVMTILIVRLQKLNMPKTAKGPYSTVHEFMEYGTLRDFVMSRYQQSSQSAPERQARSLKTQIRELLTFATDTANAMIFVDEQNFRHPVVSLKKVLLTSQCCCKLYDIYPCDMAMTKLEEVCKKNYPPLAWMAPETIFLHQYSLASDVWSYSTLLWELFSLGEIPYAGKHNNEIEEDIRRGGLLTQPANCPGAVYSTMILAWSKSDTIRPSFQLILKVLQDSLKSVEEEEMNEATQYFTLECSPINEYI